MYWMIGPAHGAQTAPCDHLSGPKTHLISLSWLLLLSLAISGCDGGSPDSSSGGSDPAGEEPLTTAGELGAAGEEPRDPPPPPPPPPTCGDHTLEGEEECDDGNFEAGDGCDPSCLIERCGNGVVQFGERCDDGDQNSDALADACRTSCVPARCGDGVTDRAEQCDDGNLNALDACRPSCVYARCGDGLLREDLSEGEPGFEACDDGELNSDSRPNACRADCSLARCGDGVRDAGEECDLGEDNSSELGSGARCRADCRAPRCGDGVSDDRPECQGQPSDPPPLCGNGVVDEGEECDLGDANSDEPSDEADAPESPPCRTSCTLAQCGDGIRDAGEACDDGNTLLERCLYGEESCEVCAPSCALISGDTSYCGDGVLDTREDCDDGNQTPGDGCDERCRPEALSCGDGVLDPGEDCDDGNSRDGDGCDFECRSECGNGALDLGEECDGGELNQRGRCDYACSLGRYLITQGEHTHHGTLPTPRLDEQGQPTVQEGERSALDQDELLLQIDGVSELSVCLTLSGQDPLPQQALEVQAEWLLSAGEGEELTEDIIERVSSPLSPTLSLNEAGNSSGCARYSLNPSDEAELSEGRGVLRVRVALHEETTALTEPLREALTASGALHQGGRALSYSAQLTLTRPLPLATTPSLDLSGRVHAGGDDMYRLELTRDSLVSLRLSADGLGACPQRADEGLGRPMLEVYQALNDGRGALFAQERQRAEQTQDASAFESCSLITSTQPWPAGTYIVRVRSAQASLNTSEYVLNARLHGPCDPQEPTCQPALNTESPLTTWVNSVGRWRGQLGELDEAYATQSAQELTEAGALYTFEVTLEEAQGALKTQVTAHLEGCGEGSGALLSLWALDGATPRLVQQAMSASATSRASGAPCQELSAELSAGRYALSVRHPTLEELSYHPHWSSNTATLDELTARATLPYELSVARYSSISGGASLTSSLELRGAPLTLGDDLISLTLSAPERLDLWLEPQRVGDCTLSSAGGSISQEVLLTLTPLGSATQDQEQLRALLMSSEGAPQGADLSDTEALEALSLTSLTAPSARSERSYEPCAQAYSLMMPAGRYLINARLSSAPLSSLTPEEQETLTGARLPYSLTISLPNRCGDGVVEGIEACDDGNRLGGDYCDARCQRTAICGDGVVQEDLGERCDDGNLEPFDGCSPECARCGDGLVEGSEECEPSSGGELCDAYCTLKERARTEATWRSDQLAISAGERDRFSIHMTPSAWLSAQTYGCEPDELGAPRRFDTTLKLYDVSGQLLASADDLNATSACSALQVFVEAPGGLGHLEVESERFNDIVGYGVSVTQHVKVGLDADGLCLLTPDTTQAVLSPRERCGAEGSASLSYEASLSVEEADEHRFKLTSKRDAFMTWTLTRPDAQTPCPASAWVSGFYDEARRPVRVDINLTPNSDLGDSLSCGELSPRLWPAGRYELRIHSEVDEAGSSSRALYTLSAELEDPVCGNGYLEVGEACDLGALNSDSAPGRHEGGDVCRTTCVYPSCGDGVRDREEACDAGALNSDSSLIVDSLEWTDATPRCRPSCELSFCGDGILDGGEECDEGEGNLPTGACLPTCKRATCGDGFLQDGVETCDDGNQLNGDGCHSACDLVGDQEDCSQLCQPEQRCPSGAFIRMDEVCPPLPETPVCGDGAVTGPERCDDGNLTNNDGCDATCQPERVLIKGGLWSTDSLSERGLHLYEFEVQSTARLTILTEPSSDALGTSRCSDQGAGSIDLDTTLTLYLLDPETGLISQQVNSSDDSSPSDRCATIEQNLYQPGRYLIEVGAFGGEPLLAPYRLRVQLARDILSAGDAQGSLKAGESHAYEVPLFDHLNHRFSFMSPQLTQLNISFRAYPLDQAIATDDQLTASQSTSHEVSLDLHSGIDPVNDPFTQSPRAERAPLARALMIIERPINAGDATLNYNVELLRPCGDGVTSRLTVDSLNLGDECDDGNTQDGDGCSAWCRIERDICGNGIREVGEACDPGHLLSDENISRTFYDTSATPSTHEMSQTTLVYFNRDTEATDVELIIDTTELDIDELSVDLRARVAFSRLSDETSLSGVADRINARFAGLVEAWAQGDQLSLITYGGKKSHLVSVSTAEEGPWRINPSQPLCDTSCTLTRQRLVATEPSAHPDYEDKIMGATEEGGHDEVYFSLDVPHSLKLSTEGCRFESATERAIDTQVTLYRLQNGVIVSEVASQDDRSTPNVDDNNTASELCAQLDIPSLPAGDYVLYISGYLDEALESYSMDFTLAIDLGELEGSLMSGLSEVTYDEFSQRNSSDHFYVTTPPGQTRYFSVELLSGDTCVSVDNSKLSLNGADAQLCTTYTETSGYSVKALRGELSADTVSVRSTEESATRRYRYKYCSNETCSEVSCGNGIIDADLPNDDQPIEECDDGNDIDDDECTNTCRRNQYDVSRSDFSGPLEPVQGEVFFPLGDDQTISFRIPSTSSGEPRHTYLFNKRYDGVRVSSNGLIGLLESTGLPPSRNFEEPSSAEGPLGQGRSFTTYQGNGCCSGQPIPSPAANTPLIAPYWEDLLGIYQLGLVSDPGSGLNADSVGNSVALLSEGGRDWLVVEWRGVSHYGGGPGGLHMQALLRIFTDGTPEQNLLNQEEAVIKLRCLNCQSDGGAHTQGLQGSRPYQGSTLTTTDAGPVYRSATSWSASNEQVTFTPHAR